MMAYSDTAAHTDVYAIRHALSSISVSGAGSAREQKIIATPIENVLIFVDNSGVEPRPFFIKVYQNETLSAWMEEAFSSLEVRLQYVPDQDLPDAAGEIVNMDSDLSENWIDSISDQWSSLRD